MGDALEASRDGLDHPASAPVDESQPYTAGTSGHFSIDRNTISSIGLWYARSLIHQRIGPE